MSGRSVDVLLRSLASLGYWQVVDYFLYITWSYFPRLQIRLKTLLPIADTSPKVEGTGMDPRVKMFRDTSDELYYFLKRAGRVWIYDELKFLDLEPDTLTGEFWQGKEQVLTDFCTANPEYHVISCHVPHVYNKFVPDACIYYLADGDADPNLMFDFETRLNLDELFQIGHGVFAPVLSKIKNRDDS
ncbi:MAG: hypothetical protein FJ146_13185 [Deltaproteobacteria bacterium]|nr:hypothetical protein [Deltaproteobacteria bacterium]